MKTVGRWLSGGVCERNMRVFRVLKVTQSLLFYIPVWVAYERQFLDFSQFTLIEAIIYGIQMALELPTGALADLWGKRMTVFSGLLVSAAGLFLYGIATSFPLFVLYACVTGIGGALISGAEEALLFDSLKEGGREQEFGERMGYFNMIFQIGLAVSAVIGGWLGSLSYSLAVWATFASTLMTAILSLFLVEPHVDTEQFTLKNYLRQTKMGIKELVKNDHIKQISLFYILVGGITWVCQLIFNASILTDLGFTPSEFGWTMALLRIINGVLLFRVLRLGSFLNRSRVFLMFPVVMTLGLLPGIWLGKWIAVPFIAAIMFSSTARWSILGKYTNEEFSSNNRATAISTLSMAIGVIYIVVAVVSGPIMQAFGGARIMYTLLGIVTLLTVLPLGIRLASAHKSQG